MNRFTLQRSVVTTATTFKGLTRGLELCEILFLGVTDSSQHCKGSLTSILQMGTMHHRGYILKQIPQEQEHELGSRTDLRPNPELLLAFSSPRDEAQFGGAQATVRMK